MCLAIPALIRTIDGNSGLVEIGGIERTVSLTLTPEAQVGDYVLLHTGYAISVLDLEEAQETLSLLAELAEFYPEATETGLAVEESQGPA